jgi:diguanylate cyclase (GGDEF)-like protein
LDLDEFKPVNDTFGHQAGDAVLATVAKRLRLVAAKDDTVARLGGDEFAMICPTIGDRMSAGVTAEKILEAIAHPIEIGPHRVVIGASVGVVVGPFDGSTPEQMLRNADIALYRAKCAGRNRHQHFNSYTEAERGNREPICSSASCSG